MTTTETKGSDPIRDFVGSYEFRGDAGDYTPTEAERVMLEDFAHSLFAEFGSFGALVDPCLPRHHRRITGKQAHLVDDVKRLG
ncbi:hypothetical protein [Xanthobacter versatilis]|uniref:hypothetical protein n=1 Tax=Xanthobacter autotrophicus (strain ATCC BAA-1158 / Py2) TaxID=78245 RepID=UPI0037280E48